MSRSFYYVNTGHRVGLDQFRRASALIEHLQDLDITLLTNDFRIASICKQYHFQRGVGIDVIRNIPNIAVRGDKMLFDSNEANDLILKDMKDFFFPFIRFIDAMDGDDENAIYGGKDGFAIASTFEEKVEKNGSTLLFFGDDDYEEDLLKLAQASELKDVDLLLGFYFFLDYEDKLAPHFKSVKEEDEYIDAIKEASLLITSSYQAALEASLAGTAVVYMQRVDYDPNYAEILENAGITVVPMGPITAADIAMWKEQVKVAKVTNSAQKLALRVKKAFS